MSSSPTTDAPPPRISVVMPVYNAARWLPTALDSIVAQTFSDFELIAVNDGSTDGSLGILQTYAARDPRIRIISRPNTGIIGALNDGLAVARGEFVARMDADDESAPDRFRQQIEYFRAHRDLVAVGSAVTFMDGKGNSVQFCPRPMAHADIERDLLAGDGGAMIHPAVMFRTDAVRQVGGYRMLDAKAQYFEDLDLFLRLARVGRLANLAAPLLRYRIHSSSINFSSNPARRALRLQVLREACAVRNLPFPPASLTDDDQHRDAARHAREWAVTSLAYGSRRVAVRHGWRAVRLRPADAAGTAAGRGSPREPPGGPPRGPGPGRHRDRDGGTRVVCQASGGAHRAGKLSCGACVSIGSREGQA